MDQKRRGVEPPARADLRADEEQFRLLMEAMPQLIWTTDRSGKPDFCNSRWRSYTGVDLVARGVARDVVVHPDDQAASAEQWKLARREEQEFEMEQRLRSARGDYRWFLTRALPMRDSSGRITKWIGTCTDIDDRKRAEEAQAFLTEVTTVLTSSLDYEETLKSAARLVVPRLADWCAIQLVGADGLLCPIAVAHVDPEKVQWAREIGRRYRPDPNAPLGVANVIRTGKAEIYADVTDAMLVASARDADHLAICRAVGFTSVMIVPLVTRRRTIGAITLVSAESKRRFGPDDLGVAEEFGRRSALAIENSVLYRDAVEASRLKDEFLATISHELRTPLNAMLGWARMLTSRKLDEAGVEKAVTVIERNAKVQVQLIEDLLDVSQIITGKLRIACEPLSLTAVIQAAIDAVKSAAAAKRIQIESSLDTSAGLVLGDGPRLQQVVWNLLVNAVKFTPEGGRIDVTLDYADGHVRVIVSDTGRGIDPAFLPYVFERFLQADSSTTRRYGGLGLGLALVRYLTELHGGTVRAESAGLGQGAAFTLIFPRSSDGGARREGPSSPAGRRIDGSDGVGGSLASKAGNAAGASGASSVSEAKATSANGQQGTYQGRWL